MSWATGLGSARAEVMPDGQGHHGPGSDTAHWVLPLWECCPDTSASAPSLVGASFGKSGRWRVILDPET